MINDQTFLYDRDALEITIERPPTDGEIIVIPEFSTILVASLMLIASLVAAYLGKTVWSKKQKDLAIA